MISRSPLLHPRQEDLDAAEKLRQEASLQIIALLVLPLLEHTETNAYFSRADIKSLCDKILEDYGAPKISAFCLEIEKIPVAREYLASTHTALVAPVYFSAAEYSEKHIKHETLLAFAANADEVELHIPSSHWQQNDLLNTLWDSCLEQCARCRAPATAVLTVRTAEELEQLPYIMRGAFSLGFKTVKISQNHLTPEYYDIALEALWAHGFDKEKRITFHQPDMTIEQARHILADVLQAGLPLTSDHVRLASGSLFFQALKILSEEKSV